MTIYSIIAVGYLFYSTRDVYDIIKAIFKREITITNVLNCLKCLSFWVSLIVFQNLVTALLISLVVFLLDTFIVTKL